MKFSFILILAVIVLWGLWGFFGKLAVQRIGIQSSFWNALTLILTITFFLLFSHQLTPVKENPSGILFAIFAGICSGLASILFFILLGQKPVGLLVATTALYPLVTLILAAIFLKESLTLVTGIGFIFALIALFLLHL